MDCCNYLTLRCAVCWECMPIDPVALTRQLIDIESITENEAAVGHFLSNYLKGLGFEVETTPVPQAAGRERFNVYAGLRPAARCGALHAYGYGAAVYSAAAKMRRTFMAAAPAMPRESLPRRLRPRSGCAKLGVRVGAAVSGWRRTRQSWREDRQPAAQREPIPDQRRTYGQPAGAGLERRVERDHSRPRKNGAFGLSGVGRLRDS